MPVVIFTSVSRREWNRDWMLLQTVSQTIFLNTKKEGKLSAFFFAFYTKKKF